MKEFEVWMEGYAATCEHDKAMLLGKVEAEDYLTMKLMHVNHSDK